MDYPPPPLQPATLPWPDLLAGAFAVSRRLVAAHSRHFLALSSLLLLPLSLLLVSLPSPSLLPSAPTLRSLPNPASAPSPLLLLLAAAAALLYLAAFAAVAGSVHAGFFGRPVRLLPSLLSIPASLLRLLLTLAAAAIPFLPLLLAPSVAAAAGGAAVLLVVLPPFWSLAGAAAVIESALGFRPLLRSCRLLAGWRCAAFSAFLFFASAAAVALWGFGGVGDARPVGGWAEAAPVVVKAVVGTAVVAALLLYGSVLNVVLYMHCRALRGELAGEIYDEFADTYVFLPFDNLKERHVVTVVRQP